MLLNTPTEKTLFSLAWIIHQSRIKIAERVILQQLRQFCHPNTL
ncbi:hypothetical protein [Cylindrospermopsis raciborskii]|nr:hypothetical protein [Cylindrospermopsis raciborskii]